MFEAQGFTLLTFVVMLGGIVAHSLKQFITARNNEQNVTFKTYYLVHWPETVVALIGSFVLWVGIPEVAQFFPAFANSIGITGGVGILSSFLCGFVGNSLADFMGGRVATVVKGE